MVRPDERRAEGAGLRAHALLTRWHHQILTTTPLMDRHPISSTSASTRKEAVSLALQRLVWLHGSARSCKILRQLLQHSWLQPRERKRHARKSINNNTGVVPFDPSRSRDDVNYRPVPSSRFAVLFRDHYDSTGYTGRRRATTQVQKKTSIRSATKQSLSRRKPAAIKGGRSQQLGPATIP
jgi:hypothetical protein